jgi:hypothetical protein
VIRRAKVTFADLERRAQVVLAQDDDRDGRLGLLRRVYADVGDVVARLICRFELLSRDVLRVRDED